MTAGLAILKKISWPLKKKRPIGDSRVNQRVERRKSSTEEKARTSKQDNFEDFESFGSLEIVAPFTSGLEFKYNWPVDGFLNQVKTCKENGINSRTFSINVNGIATLWKLSLQFWVDGHGSRLSNPVVICLNLVGCRGGARKDLAVKYKFGIYNQNSQEIEMGSANKASIMVEEVDKLKSVGYKNIAISDKHVNSEGDVMFSVSLSIIHKEEESHSLSSDLSSLINDQKSADCILQAGNKTWQVHSNILAARSPVFAQQLDGSNIHRNMSSSSETFMQLDEDNILSRAPKEEETRGYNDDNMSRKESIQKLVITDLPSETVEELLCYIYTDNSTNVDTYPQTLLAASDQYQLPGLKLSCEKHLGEIISPLNVGEILFLSDNYKCEALKKSALAFCEENHSFIMKDSSWKRMEEENPTLFSEAISCVAPDRCDKHQNCIEKGVTRYHTEMDKKKTYKKSLVPQH